MNKFEYFLEDGSKIVDTKFSNYNKGTQFMLEILDEQEHVFDDITDYENIVKELEACRDEYDVEEVMYEVGTDYIDEMEVHIMWNDLMFPRVIKSPYFTYIGDEVVS